MPTPKVAPSLLSSDFARLADECNRMLELGADWLHMDIMDGHFVPNITMGAPVIAAVRKHTKGFLDCHLMVSKPEQWVDDFAQAGADMYTFHIEAAEDASALIDKIHKAGMKAGVSIKPKTPVETAFSIAEKADMILIMTVEPGFGGQKFMSDCIPKVRELRKRFPDLDIEVDGGLDLDTVDTAAEAGANVIVAGSAVFKANSPGAVINGLKDSVAKHQTAAAAKRM